MIENGICKDCNKAEKGKRGKLENSYKVCPFCGEKIKAIAIKCRFCQQMLSENNNKNSNKIEQTNIQKSDISQKINESSENIIEEKLPKGPAMSLTLGILSVFFFQIGIVPTIAVIISITTIIKYKSFTTKHKAFAVIGLILSVIYFLMYVLVYSKVGPQLKF